MAQTVADGLQRLRENPWDTEAGVLIDQALESGLAENAGDHPERTIELARHAHERRGEFDAVAALMVVELKHFSTDKRFAVALWKEFARVQQEELLSDERAREAYEQARALGDVSALSSLQEIEAARERWREIADRLIDEAKSVSDKVLKASLLMRAGSLVWQYKDKSRMKETERLFKNAVKTDPSSARAARLYARILRDAGRLADAGKTYAEAADAAASVEERLGLSLHAARAFLSVEGHEEDVLRAYERVIELEPSSPEALRTLVAAYTEAEDWDRLVFVYEGALRARTRMENEVGTLLQLGMVHWRIRNAPAEAEPWFGRLRKLAPDNLAVVDFYREFLGTSEDPEAIARLLSVLTDAQRSTTDEVVRRSLAEEIALRSEKNGALDRAVDGWKYILRQDPSNSEAKAKLRSLYAQGRKWNALVELLRAELDTLPPRAADAAVSTARVEILRELIRVYRMELKLDAMAISSYNELLEERPKDVDALAELAAVYEGMGRWNDLIGALGRQVDITEDPEEKVNLYLRIAGVWIERFANYNQAAKPLEAIVDIDPNNRKALSDLKTIYEKKRSWKQLYAVLEKESQLASDPVVRFDSRVDLARIAAERLHQYADAVVVWQELLSERPDFPDGLPTLVKLSEREKNWAVLVWALEKQTELETQKPELAKLFTRLGTVYAEQLHDVGPACGAWRRLLALEPGNGRALRTLRDLLLVDGNFAELEELYLEAKEYEGLVDVLGHAALQSTDVETVKKHSFRAAEIYETLIGHPERAFRSYERVLAVDPQNLRAARALAPLYHDQGKWEQLGRMKQIMLPHETDRVAALIEYSTLLEDKLGDTAASLKCAQEAFELAPKEKRALARFESASKGAGNFLPLVIALETRLDSAFQAETEYVSRKLADLARDELKDAGRERHYLETILGFAPRDRAVIERLAAIYQATGDGPALLRLKESELAHSESDSDRRQLRLELVAIARSLGDEDRAYKELLALREELPGDLSTLRDVFALAQKRDDREVVLRTGEDLVSISPDAERGPLLLKLAGLYIQDDAAGADVLRCLTSALDLDPAQPGLEAQMLTAHAKLTDKRDAFDVLLERFYEGRNDNPNLVRLLEARSARMPEASRAELQLRIADLKSQFMGDSSGAYDVLEGLFLDKPSDAALWERLASVAETSGRQLDLAAAFATVVEAGNVDETSRVELARRAAHLYLGTSASSHHAYPLLQLVLKHDPLDEDAFGALKDAYTSAERWDELQALYKERINETMDVSQRLELLLQQCFLFEELIEDDAAAIRAYEGVLELDPGHASARRTLERLYRKNERWRELAAHLAEDAEGLSDKRAIAEAQYEIGQLLESKVGDGAAAIDWYERVLEVAPAHANAQLGLERLMVPPFRVRVAEILESIYENQGAWSRLAVVLRVLADEEGEPGAQSGLHQRLATLLEDRLGDSAGGFEHLGRALALTPGDRLVRAELERLSGVLQRGPQYADLLESAATAASGEERSSLLMDAAKMWGDRLGEDGKAEALYRQLMDNDDVAIATDSCSALAAIYEKRGEHAALVRVLELGLKHEFDASVRSTRWARIAAIREGALNDREGAIRAHESRLEIDSGDVDALRELERLYEESGEWTKLIAILHALQSAPGLTEEQTRSYAYRIGTVYEEELNDTDNAIAAFNDVDSHFGKSAEVSRRLTHLYLRTERWEDAKEELLCRIGTGAEDQTALQVELAQLERLHLANPLGAVDLLDEVLTEHPEQPEALAAIRELVAVPESALPAARVLTALASRKGDPSLELAGLFVLAESDDLDESARSLERAAELSAQLNRYGDAARFSARTLLTASTEALALARMTSFESYARQMDDGHLEVARVYREHASELPSVALRVRAWREVARVSQAFDLRAAKDAWLQVLGEQRDHQEALKALLALSKESGDVEATLHVLEQQIEFSSSPKERAELFAEIAQTYESKDATSEAVDAWEDVLRNDERNENAFDGIRRALTKEQRWDELLDSYDRELAQGSSRNRALRLDFCRVALERMGAPERALSSLRPLLEGGFDRRHGGDELVILEELLAYRETEFEAAELLQPAYLQERRWKDLLRVLEVEAKLVAPGVSRVAVLERMANVHEDQLEDLEGTFGIYERVFIEIPDDTNAWNTLVRVAKAVGSETRAADVFARWVVENDDGSEVRFDLATIAARIYDANHRAVDAARMWKIIFETDATNTEAFEGLERLLTGPEEKSDLYRKRAERAETEVERAEMLLRLGLELERGDHANEAVAALDEASIILPLHTRIASELERLLRVQGRFEDLVTMMLRRIEATSVLSERIALRCKLALLLGNEVGDVGRAVDVLEEASLEAPHHNGVTATLEGFVLNAEHQLRIASLLEPTYRAMDEWMKLVAVLEARVAGTTDRVQAAEMLSEIGQLHEHRGRDWNLALAAWVRAFEIEPTGPARAEVERLGARVEAPEVLVHAYESAAAGVTDPDLQSELLLRVAELHDERCGDPRSALDVLSRVVALEVRADAALDSMEALQTMVGDWDGFVGTMEQKVARAASDEDRADLLRRSASVTEELLSDADAAAVLYERALDCDDGDLVSLASLDRIYTAQANGAALERVLGMRLEREVDPQDRLEAAERLGELALLREGGVNDAIAANLAAIDIAPERMRPYEALLGIYEREAMWPEFIDIAQRRAALLAPGEPRDAALFRAAQVMETEVDDVHGALRIYEELLERRPDHAEVTKCLQRVARLDQYRVAASDILLPVFESQSNWQGVADLRLLRAEAEGDPAQGKLEFVTLAEVRERGLHDYSGAFSAMARAFAHDPSDEAILAEIERLGGLSGKHAALADELHARALSAMHPEVAHRLWVSLGRVAETKLEDLARATDAYTRAREQVGDDPEILANLDRLLGAQGRVSEQVEVIERRAFAASDAERVKLLLRQAEALLGLRETRQAYEILRDIVDQEPTNGPAVDALLQLGQEDEFALDVVETLEPVFRSTGDLHRVAALYDVRVRLAQSDGERSEMLKSAAALWSEELGEPARSVPVLRRAAELDPSDYSLAHLAEANAQRAGDLSGLRGFAESVAASSAADRSARIHYLSTAVRWYRDLLADDQAALALAEQLTQLDPGNEAHYQTAAECAHSTGNLRSEVAALRGWARIDPSESSKMARLELAMERASASTGDAIDETLRLVIGELLGVAPSNGRALEALEGIERRAKNWTEVTTLLRRRAEGANDGESVAILKELANVQEHQLADLKATLATLMEVEALVPTDESVLEHMSSVLEHMGATDLQGELLRVTERRIELTVDVAMKVELHRKAATLCSAEPERRLEHLQAAVDLEPDHAATAQQLAEQLERSGRFDELSRLMSLQLATARSKGDVASLLSHAHTLSRIFEKHLQAPERALGALQEALTQAPRDEATLRRVAELAAAQGDFEQELDALERLVALSVADKSVLIERIASMLEIRPDEEERTAAALARLVSDSKSEESETRLVDFLTTRRRFQDLAAFLESRVPSDSVDAGRMKALARLYHEELGDPSRAVEWLQRAVNVAPDDRDALLPLCDSYIAAGREREAVDTLTQIITSFGKKRTKELAEYHHRLARALERLGDGQRALEEMENAFKRDLNNVKILCDLGALARRTGALERAQKAYQALLLHKLEGAPLSKADVCYELGAIHEARGEKDKAIPRLERALAEDPTHAAARALLQQLKLGS